ncbi:class D sortase [Candidatus Gracilibacteria bacterium]|nr:class D sortase [Candidatus Gracilibacteria bacterium]
MLDQDPHKPEPNYFRLHVESSKSEFLAEKPIEDIPFIEQQSTPEPPKRPSALQSFARQLLASLIFLAVGFLILNWSSYSQIFKLRFERIFDINQENPLTELVEEKEPQETYLVASADPEVQKRQIPPLDLEITPLENRLVVPRINQNIPIVRVSSESLIKRDFGALEGEMQKALQDGVVHYPGTSLPGQRGNTVITGHSSYFPWDPGRFKDVFALLHDVVVGDKIVVYYKQTKYTYEISDIEVVLPEEIDVLKQTPSDQLTLITCTPVGTNLKRLIVKAKPIAINDQPIPTLLQR